MMDRGLLDKQSALSKTSSFWSEGGQNFARIKVGIFIFLGIISSLTLGYFFRNFLVWGDYSVIYMIIAATGFLIILNLQPFFIEDREVLIIVALLESIAMVGNFGDKISWTLLISFVFVFLFLLSGLFNGLRELEESLRIRFWQVSRLVLPKGVAAISLFISIFSVLNLQSDPNKFFISQETFDRIFSINTPLIQRFYPGVDPLMTMEAAAKTIAQNQLNQFSEFKLLPQKAQDRELKKQTDLLISRLSQYAGSPISPRINIQDALFKVIEAKYSVLPESIKTLVLIGFGTLIFLTIAALTWPIRLVIAFIAFLFYEILITAGFAKISIETRSKEVIFLD